MNNMYIQFKFYIVPLYCTFSKQHLWNVDRLSQNRSILTEKGFTKKEEVQETDRNVMVDRCGTIKTERQTKRQMAMFPQNVIVSKNNIPLQQYGSRAQHLKTCGMASPRTSSVYS